MYVARRLPLDVGLSGPSGRHLGEYRIRYNIHQRAVLNLGSHQRSRSRAQEMRVSARALLSGARPLPHFLVIGAQRAGSTTFFGNLADHPDVRPPIRKEVHYFSGNYERGINWYRAHFPLSPARVPSWKTFEATPYYLFHPMAPSRIHQALPNVQLIVILRDPIDRAASHYRLNVARGNEHLTFEEAILAEPARVPTSLRDLPPGSPEFDQHRLYSYIARGHYAEQLERWFSFFEPSRFHIVDFADLANDLRGTIASAANFLGLRDFEGGAPRRRGMTTSPVAAQIDGADRLSDHFRPHNERLFKLLGRTFDWR